MDLVPPIRLAIWLLAIIAVFTVLRVASGLFAPIIFALVVGVVLSPIARKIDRLGPPPALSAFITLLLLLAFLVGLFLLIEPVLSRAITRAPFIWAELRETFVQVRIALQGLNDVSDQVADALTEGPAVAAPDAPADPAMPSISDALWMAPEYAARAMIFVGTLYFFLLSRRDVYGWISGSAMRVRTEDMLEAEHEVSRYFLTITIINLGFATIVTLALLAIGMPYAILWGFTAFLANFILYLGPAAFALALLLGGLVSFAGPISFAPVVIYVSLNLTEGQFVTPSLVGRQMAVNPLLVFLSLVVWLWLWGPIGGIIAIPLLVWSLALIKRFRVNTVTAEEAKADLANDRGVPT